MTTNDCLYIKGDTLDDLLFDTFNMLMAKPFNNQATRSSSEGPFSELIGVTLELSNPQARLSKSDAKGKPFSPLGELLWYFSGSDELEFVQYYISAYKKESHDGEHIYGAYGPRFFSPINQINNVLALLKKNPPSKRAIIQIFESRDILDIPETVQSIPCTCYLQLLYRENRLHMIANMRSNDAFRGLPHDIYAFTMLQEYIAKSLGYETGIYKHFAGSLHLYEKSKPEVQDYIREGIQPTTGHMSAMPEGDQFHEISELLKIEEAIRNGATFDIENSTLHPYWKELAYLLVFFKGSKLRDASMMIEAQKHITSRIYTPFLEKKIRAIIK